MIGGRKLVENNYIGFTIGPIYKTITNARKTSELWGSSFIFSHIMKDLIKYLFDNKKQLIIPFVDESSFIMDENKDIGIFSDRCILLGNIEDLRIIKERFDFIIKRLSEDAVSTLNINTDSNSVHQYFKKYFSFYGISLKTSKNPIIEVSKYLDNMELQQNFISKEDVNYVEAYLSKENIKNSQFYKEALGKESFRSLIQISSGLDYYIDDDSDEVNLIKEKHKKYISIIHSDGDNIGSIIKKSFIETDTFESNIQRIKTFSKKLSIYAKDASQVIKKYGGVVIYAGGDDMLFFAPVLNNQNKKIFNLLDDLDNIFKRVFKEEIDAENDKKPSISYGLLISFYKYPLNEAINQSRILLGSAKANKTKNKIAFKLLKHSGQTIVACIGKDSKSYTEFKNILDDKKSNELFISSIHNKINLDIMHNLLIELFKVDNSASRYRALFDNFFNEREHLDNPILKSLPNFLVNTYEDLSLEDNSRDNGEETLKNVYSCLKFIGFLKESSKELV